MGVRVLWVTLAVAFVAASGCSSDHHGTTGGHAANGGDSAAGPGGGAGAGAGAGAAGRGNDAGGTAGAGAATAGGSSGIGGTAGDGARGGTAGDAGQAAFGGDAGDGSHLGGGAGHGGNVGVGGDAGGGADSGGDAGTGATTSAGGTGAAGTGGADGGSGGSAGTAAGTGGSGGSGPLESISEAELDNDEHVCLVRDGSVKCWGNNQYGQLGVGDGWSLGSSPSELGDALGFVELGLGKRAVAVTVGSMHSCALLEDGSVKCWGSNFKGQLGVGDTRDRGMSAADMGDALPAVQLGSGRRAVAIQALGRATCALLDNGSIKCWGDNSFFQLGLLEGGNRGDAPGEMGDALPAVDLGSGRTAVALTGGCAILDDDSVACWGTSLRTVDFGGKVASVAPGAVCAVMRDGSLKCVGGNSYGQLGQGDKTDRSTPVTVDLGSKRVLQVSPGTFHTCALLEDHSVKCWGANFDGQLGLGDTADRGDGPGEMGESLPAVNLGSGHQAVQVSAGSYSTCVRFDDDTVKCWGLNAHGEAGVPYADIVVGDEASETGDALPVVNLGPVRPDIALAAGGAHACAVIDGHTIKCWGFNNYGNLGLGDKARRGDGSGEMGTNLPAVDLGTSARVVLLTAGIHHTCAGFEDGVLKCWGDNAGAQLGLGNTAARGDNANEMGTALPAVNLGTGRRAMQVALGLFHSCALLDDGRVKCWGTSTDGELGQGDTATRGDGAGEMGDALPSVNLGTGRTARALAAGLFHTCALLDDGGVKCWGFNAEGELGLGDTDNRGDEPGEMGDSLPEIYLGSGRTAVAIASGVQHTCAYLDDQSVKCWGYNSDGELGRGDTANRGDDPSDTLAPVDLDDPVSSIEAGWHHTCALVGNRIYCWGDNSSGQLGVGDTNNRGDAPDELDSHLMYVDFGLRPGNMLQRASAFSAGGDFSCAVLTNRTVKCWGENSDGQLGLGDSAARGDGASEMGNALPLVDLGVP